MRKIYIQFSHKQISYMKHKLLHQRKEEKKNNQHNGIKITERGCHIKSKPVFTFTCFLQRNTLKVIKYVINVVSLLAAAQSKRLKYLTRSCNFVSFFIGIFILLHFISSYSRAICVFRVQSYQFTECLLNV